LSYSGTLVGYAKGGESGFLIASKATPIPTEKK
jgi:hypothetical protein